MVEWKEQTKYENQGKSRPAGTGKAHPRRSFHFPLDSGREGAKGGNGCFGKNAMASPDWWLARRPWRLGADRTA